MNISQSSFKIIRVCRDCNNQFIYNSFPGVKSRRLYCDICSLKNRSTRYNLICEYCNKAFVAIRKPRRFCELSCAQEYATKQTLAYYADRALNCSTCGIEIHRTNSRKARNGFNYCSQKCFRSHKQSIVIYEECLASINTAIYEWKRRLDFARLASLSKASVQKGYNRERIIRLSPERFVPNDIFKRDNWICQICGEPTIEYFRGTNNPKAPELDHIIPLSRGGTHIMDNVQCACRKCNGDKGDKLPGES